MLLQGMFKVNFAYQCMWQYGIKCLHVLLEGAGAAGLGVQLTDGGAQV